VLVEGAGLLQVVDDDRRVLDLEYVGHFGRGYRT